MKFSSLRRGFMDAVRGVYNFVRTCYNGVSDERLNTLEDNTNEIKKLRSLLKQKFSNVEGAIQNFLFFSIDLPNNGWIRRINKGCKDCFIANRRSKK